MTTEPIPNSSPSESPPALLPPAPTFVSRPTSALSIISLVFGILGWLGLPFFGSVVAVITGHMARAEIRNSQGGMEGDGMAVAGLALGWTLIGLCVLVVIGFVLMIAFLGGLAAASSAFSH